MKSKKTFVTLFIQYEDFHFWKDPGQIPYRFSKLGYDAKILTKNTGPFKDTNRFIETETIPNKSFFGKDISVLLYFLKNSKSIDILNIFHLNSWTGLFAGFLYKLINPKGFVYLKMDNCHASGIYGWEKLFDKSIDTIQFGKNNAKPGIKRRIKDFLFKRHFIKSVDLFSVEDEESKDYFEKKYSFFKDKIMVAYNGHTIDLVDKNNKVKSFEEKENLMITVGRLGTFPKNTLNLLKGFADTANLHNWNLVLAGPVDPEFITDKEHFFKEYPQLVNRIRFVGNLDKPQLFDLYNRAKIFLLPSNFEGFAIVYSEAMFFGNAIITSPYTSVKDILVRYNMGLLIEPEKPEEIGSAVLELVKDDIQLKEFSNNAREFAERELSWDSIVNKVQREILVRLKKRK